VNADTAASALATALGAEKLIVLTRRRGASTAHWPDSEEIVTEIDATELKALLPALDAA